MMKTFESPCVAICIAAFGASRRSRRKERTRSRQALKGNAARLCKQLRADMGAVAFRSAYASKSGKHNAFGKCVKQTEAHSSPHEAQGRQEGRRCQHAQDECQAELAGNTSTFDSQYGSDEQDANDEGRRRRAQ